mmetsp:Transcript_17509/g.19496  ORF Transcript_17509/g.19496 Transcript_17509/m.19496 type:complete len:280 (+) Transcript_17509:17-856(+)
MKLVDVWAQPAGTTFLELLPESKRVSGFSGLLGKESFEWTPQSLEKKLDEGNVDKTILSAWCRPGKWVVTNERIAEFVRYNPAKFIGCGSVNLADPVSAVKEAERCIRELNFKAIRVVPWLWKLPPNHKLYYPLFVKCIELDVPFCTQVGHTGPLMPSDTGRPIPYIDEIALTFPDLKIVCGHVGYPWTNEMIAVAWKHKNVYIDTSAYDPRYYPKELLHFAKTYGREKVMFGTNFPMLGFDTTSKGVRELTRDWDKEARECFMWKNAFRVFKLPEARL